MIKELCEPSTSLEEEPMIGPSSDIADVPMDLSNDVSTQTASPYFTDKAIQVNMNPMKVITVFPQLSARYDTIHGARVYYINQISRWRLRGFIKIL